MTFRTIYTPEWIHSLLRRKVFSHLPVNSLNVVHSHICNTNKQKWFRCRLLSVGSAEYINTPTRLYWRLRFEPLLNAQLEICSKVFQALRYFSRTLNICVKIELRFHRHRYIAKRWISSEDSRLWQWSCKCSSPNPPQWTPRCTLTFPGFSVRAWELKTAWERRPVWDHHDR